MIPIIPNLINLLPGVVNTIGNIFKDKKKAKDDTSSLMAPLMADAANVAKGVELSSKSIMGYGLGSMIVMYALKQDLSQKHNLIILGLGAGLVAITTIMKVFEK